jgi:hypothetical protein
MSQGRCCRCPESRIPGVIHRNWGVSQRHQRCSAFDGYHPKRSPYSAVRCLSCGATWRTSAAYAEALPDIVRQDGAWQKVSLGNSS